jgi:hypothetical protein
MTRIFGFFSKLLDDDARCLHAAKSKQAIGKRPAEDRRIAGASVTPPITIDRDQT